MSGASATTSDTEIARNPHQPEGWRRDGIHFFVPPPPRTRRRRARHERHRIYETRH